MGGEETYRERISIRTVIALQICLCSGLNSASEGLSRQVQARKHIYQSEDILHPWS